MAKKVSLAYPNIPFVHAGKPLSTSQQSQVEKLLELPSSCSSFLAWHNGGVPKLNHFDWTTSRRAKRTSRIDSLFGIDCSHAIHQRNRRLDLIWAILRFRHWLPKWSIPLGFVDDDWFLITFTTYDDNRVGQVWLKEWSHDLPNDRLDSNKGIHFVSNSLIEFVQTWYGPSDLSRGS
jgi:hypothetical protein